MQRIASATARPTAERRRLAGRLSALAAPGRDLDTDLEDLPLGPRRRPTARLVTACVVRATLIAALAAGIADLTRSREEHADASEATSEPCPSASTRAARG